MRGFGKIMAGLEMISTMDLSSCIQMDVQYSIRHHTSEIDTYLGLLTELDKEDISDYVSEPVEDYLNNKLPKDLRFIKSWADPRVFEELETKADELKETYKKVCSNYEQK